LKRNIRGNKNNQQTTIRKHKNRNNVIEVSAKDEQVNNSEDFPDTLKRKRTSSITEKTQSQSGMNDNV